MRINNYTDIPTEKIRELIRFARPARIANFDVMVKNRGGRGCRGSSYSKGSSYHATSSPFIVISIQKNEGGYPRQSSTSGQGYLPFVTFNRLENFLFVLSHEMRHLWQSKVPKGWRVWGARGKFSERDADAYGIRIVRQWRKLNYNPMYHLLEKI